VALCSHTIKRFFYRLRLHDSTITTRIQSEPGSGFGVPGFGRDAPTRTSKPGAKQTNQVRVGGSVLLVFDRAGLLKANQLRGDATGFRVCLAFTVWHSCPPAPEFGLDASFPLSIVSETPGPPLAGQPDAAWGRLARAFASEWRSSARNCVAKNTSSTSRPTIQQIRALLSEPQISAATATDYPSAR
jgi:hypothetical protein